MWRSWCLRLLRGRPLKVGGTLNTCKEINLLRVLDDAKDSCSGLFFDIRVAIWRGEVAGVIAYRDGSHGELVVGMDDPEIMYAKLHQMAHKFLKKFLTVNEEI